MICPACGHANPDGTLSCGRCGTRLAPPCAACGLTLTPESRFCNHCGRPVAGPASSPPPAPPPILPSAFASGRYQVRHLLGEGGKKKVYLVYDTVLDREV